jgi:hypothetical protein
MFEQVRELISEIFKNIKQLLISSLVYTKQVERNSDRFEQVRELWNI